MLYMTCSAVFELMLQRCVFILFVSIVRTKKKTIFRDRTLSFGCCFVVVVLWCVCVDSTKRIHHGIDVPCIHKFDTLLVFRGVE